MKKVKQAENGRLKFNDILSGNLFKEWKLLQNKPPICDKNLTGIA